MLGRMGHGISDETGCLLEMIGEDGEATGKQRGGSLMIGLVRVGWDRRVEGEAACLRDIVTAAVEEMSWHNARRCHRATYKFALHRLVLVQEACTRGNTRESAWLCLDTTREKTSRRLPVPSRNQLGRLVKESRIYLKLRSRSGG